MKKLLIAIVILIPVTVLLWVGIVRYRPSCVEQKISEQMSPDGRYVAVWMVRKCSTTSYTEHINFRPLSDNFHPSLWDGTIKSGEVIAVDSKDGRITSYAWAGSRRLRVEYQGPEPLPHRENLWRDVTVEYPNP